jgi:ribonuclease HI
MMTSGRFGMMAAVDGAIRIYTDGACSGNPGPGGWAAIVAYPEGRVRELGGAAPKTTNNRMEMGAVIAALEAAADRPEPAVVHTDSTYVISGVTEWIAGWKRRGWLSSTGSAVLNRDLWERLDALAQGRRGRLRWRYVRGHSGHDANERCDELAVAFSKGKPAALYDGPAAGYRFALPEGPDGAEPPARSKSPRGARKPAGGVYLSLVEGVLERHATWAECEARVKGRRALFKKVSGSAEEEATLRSWGLPSPPRGAP